MVESQLAGLGLFPDAGRVELCLQVILSTRREIWFVGQLHKSRTCEIEVPGKQRCSLVDLGDRPILVVPLLFR